MPFRTTCPKSTQSISRLIYKKMPQVTAHRPVWLGHFLRWGYLFSNYSNLCVTNWQNKIIKQNLSQTTNHNREQLIEFQIKNKVSLVYFMYCLLKKYSWITSNLIGPSVWCNSTLGGCPGRYSQSFSSGYGDFTQCGYVALILGRAYPRQSTESGGPWRH